MPGVQVVGFVFVGAAGVLALRMRWIDRRLQDFRAPGVSRAAYLFVPVRWQRRLYTEAGQPLVGQAWRTLLTMYGSAFVALVLLMAGAR